MTRRLACAICCLLLFWLASCSNGPAEPTDPTSGPTDPTSGPSAPASSGAATPATSPSAGPSSSASASGGGEAADSFTFEDAASFEDGISLEIAFTLADNAKDTDKGAEGTKGQVVVFVIKLVNESAEEYDPSDALVTATYGKEKKEAQIIVDETGELQSGFSGVIATGEEANAQIGFAIPAAESGDVTITVDLNDTVHDAISFTGAAAQN